MRNIHRMVQTFAALADPSRLRMVTLLRDGPRSVLEIGKRLRMAQPRVSKHLKTLREAGLVSVEARAQRRVYALAPAPLEDLDTWLAPYRTFWERRFAALDARLSALPAAPRRKR